jgi:hypothetical protein
MSTSTLGLLPWTLVGVPGVGPSRERALWAAGGWNREALPEALAVVGVKGPRAGEVVAHARLLDAAVAKRDVATLWNMLPTRERWRVLPLVLEDAACVDIEMDGSDGPESITAVCVRTRTQAECWLKGMPDWTGGLLARSQALISFNGQAFDVPQLRKRWPELPLPRVHVDLVSLARRTKLQGGLKALERLAGWERAPHVAELRGGDAVGLWGRWVASQDRAALQLLCEYNMEDVWSLPYLAAWFHDSLVGRLSAAPMAAGAPKPGPLLDPWQTRGDAGPMMLGAVAAAMAGLR